MLHTGCWLGSAGRTRLRCLDGEPSFTSTASLSRMTCADCSASISSRNLMTSPISASTSFFSSSSWGQEPLRVKNFSSCGRTPYHSAPHLQGSWRLSSGA
jgi:hypothetical protein